MDRTRIVIVGLGGIGSWLVQGLCPFLNYQDSHSYTLILIDGDDYEPKNHSRQVFTGIGPKTDIQAEWITRTFTSGKLMARSVPEFISAGGAKDTLPIGKVIQNGDIIFSCVDNHKTRKVISKYCASLEDVTLISGGNEYHDGNIQVFMRRKGEDITPTLEKYHPELAEPKDKAPFELSCEEAAVSTPQLIFCNMTVATLMLNAFYGIKEGKFDAEKPEVYFDILANAAVPRVRKK